MSLLLVRQHKFMSSYAIANLVAEYGMGSQKSSMLARGPPEHTTPYHEMKPTYRQVVDLSREVPARGSGSAQGSG